MEVKSYYATSVETAMVQARKELGEDALLLRITPAPREFAHLGPYEVFFVGEPKTVSQQSPQMPVAKESYFPSRPLDLVPRKSEFAALLELAGVDEAESKIFFDGEQSRPAALPEVAAVSAAPGFACSPGLGMAGGSDAMVALVGAAGAGKTTMLMKLAVAEGLLRSRPVCILAFHPEHIGAGARLQRFAEVLRIPFEEFETGEQLSAALKHPSAGLTLVDTAGYGREDGRSIAALGKYLSAQQELEVQLVLRLDRKTADNLDVIRRFAPLRPQRLMFTALDESRNVSDAVALMEEARIPVSFLGAGQRIPEDLERATGEQMASWATDRVEESARSAA